MFFGKDQLRGKEGVARISYRSPNQNAAGEQNLTAGVQLNARYPVLWLSFDCVWQPGEYFTKLVQLRLEHEPVACEQLRVLIVRELLLWIDIALAAASPLAG
jgi:hypothetical protein